MQKKKTSSPTLTLAELAAEFDIAQAHAGGAIVDVTKLDSLQAAEIRKRFLEQPVASDLLALVQQDLRDALSPHSSPHSSSPSHSGAQAVPSCLLHSLSLRAAGGAVLSPPPLFLTVIANDGRRFRFGVGSCGSMGEGKKK